MTWRCIQHGSEASRGVDTIAWLVVLTKMSQIRKSFATKLSLTYSFGRLLQLIGQKYKLGTINPASFG